jgi:hypothetical protein
MVTGDPAVDVTATRAIVRVWQRGSVSSNLDG